MSFTGCPAQFWAKFVFSKIGRIFWTGGRGSTKLKYFDFSHQVISIALGVRFLLCSAYSEIGAKKIPENRREYPWPENSRIPIIFSWSISYPDNYRSYNIYRKSIVYEKKNSRKSTGGTLATKIPEYSELKLNLSSNQVRWT